MADSVSEAVAPPVASDARKSRSGRGSDALGWDFFEGLAAWRLWTTLGWNDIRQRYRRSTLGPFWITLSMSVLVIVLGLVYSRIFHTEIETYLPFLALGFIYWGFISSAISESCEAFRESAQIIKQIKVPFSIHVLRVIWRNFIVFLHTIIIFIPIALVFGMRPHLTALLALPGLVLLYINLTWLGLVLAILSTRFRDVPPIVMSILQIMLFASPIMWPVSAIGDSVIADVNPIYHLLELVRAPLLGDVPPTISWVVVISMASVGSMIAITLFRSVSRQIVYWL